MLPAINMAGKDMWFSGKVVDFFRLKIEYKLSVSPNEAQN